MRQSPKLLLCAARSHCLANTDCFRGKPGKAGGLPPAVLASSLFLVCAPIGSGGDIWRRLAARICSTDRVTDEQRTIWAHLATGSLLALSAARLYPLSLNTADVIEDLRTHCQISPACSKISSIAVLPVMVCGGGMAEGVNGVSDNAIGEISGEVWWLSGRDVAVRVLLSLVARLAGRSTSGTSNEAIQSGAATKAAGVGAVIRV
ncbi:hypothetical protein MRX96_006721 [Rhipicephalus microplus]